MKRQLSSKQTFFLRIVLPVWFVIIVAAATFAIYSQSGESGKPAVFLFPAIFILIFPIILLILNIFKVVSVDDNFLYVSNYLKEVSIPLSNIRDVTESRLRGHPVTIHFQTKTEFGSKITFIPKMRFLDFTSHPVVAELKDLAKIK